MPSQKEAQIQRSLVSKSLLNEIQSAFVAIFGNVLHPKSFAAVGLELFSWSRGWLDKAMDHALVGGYAKQKKGD